MKQLQPFMKAIAPAVLALVGTLANSLVDGQFDVRSIEALVGGLVISAVVYFVPNAKPVAPIVAPVAPVAPPVVPPKP